MIIKAKFNSKCPVCGKEIQIGQEVSWNPGSKATCPECQNKAPKTLPGKVKITKLKFGKLYKKIPLMFDSKELAQDFINNQLADHWYKLDQIEIVQGI